MDSTGSDALLVLDMDSASASYGELVGSVEVGATGTMPHHIERRVDAQGRVIANGWLAGKSWVFDVTTPRAPTIHATLTTAGGILGYPHDFTRLPNGNILVAFNSRAGTYAAPGGLAELDASGATISAVASSMAGIGDTSMVPYSLTLVPGTDRAMVALGEMGMMPFDKFPFRDISAVQLWNTKPLAPIAFIPLPISADDKAHLWPSSAEAMANGEVFVNTFRCGLFHLRGLKGDSATAVRVHTFPSTSDDRLCGVAETVGNYWIQAVAEISGLIVLDLSDPAAPREVSRITLDKTRYPNVHWVSANRQGTRLAVTGESPWVVMLTFDPATGAIGVDQQFRTAGDSLPGRMTHAKGGAMMHPHGVAWGP